MVFGHFDCANGGFEERQEREVSADGALGHSWLLSISHCSTKLANSLVSFEFRFEHLWMFLDVSYVSSIFGLLYLSHDQDQGGLECVPVKNLIQNFRQGKFLAITTNSQDFYHRLEIMMVTINIFRSNLHFWLAA